MAFVLSKEIRKTYPVAKTGDLEIDIFTTDKIIQTGNKAVLQFIITDDATTDGDTFTVLNKIYTVDNSLSSGFTDSSFKQDANSVDNFFNMIRSDSRLTGIQILNLGTAVLLLWQESELIKDFVNDVSTTNGIIMIEQNGQPYQFIDLDFWFVISSQGLPLTEKIYSQIPNRETGAISTVGIKINDLVKGLVSTTVPWFSMSIPIKDTKILRPLDITFGTAEYLNCDRIESTAKWHGEFNLVNSVFQEDEFEEFLPYSRPDNLGIVKFLTDRPICFPICFGSYEWIWIYLHKSDLFTNATQFVVVYQFKQTNGDPLRQVEAFLGSDGVYCIPSGTDNQIVNNELGTSNEYTIQVFAKFSNDILFPYSEKRTYRCYECSCNEEEIYFLSSLGGYDTMSFERIESGDLIVEGVTTETELNRTSRRADTFYNQGARQNHIQNVDEKYFLRSIIIKGKCNERCWYEQFLASPFHYIRTVDAQGIEIMRRVIVDMETTRLYTAENVTRLFIGFTFTNTKNHH